MDKANVLEVSRLWRTVVTERRRASFPTSTLTHEFVDTAAMKLALAPAKFDVLLIENMFGDILSDEAGAVCGSLGLLPSASLGDGAGLFEPVHGSAPDIAGKDIANPIGAIASAAMLLSDGLGLKTKARRSSPPSSARFSRDFGRRTLSVRDRDRSGLRRWPTRLPQRSPRRALGLRAACVPLPIAYD